LAYFHVRDSLNPYKVVKFSITLQQYTLKGYDGDNLWTAEINTLEPSTTVSGGIMRSRYIHLRTLQNLDDEIEKAAADMCQEIDWTPRIPDRSEPYVYDTYPSNQATEIDIDSTIWVAIKDSLPSAGIDISTIEAEVNGVDVTSEIEITGNPYDYKVKWKPSLVIRESV